MSEKTENAKRIRGRRKRRRPIRNTFLALAAVFLVICGVFTFAVVDRMKTQQLDFVSAAADVARDNNLGPLVAAAENFYYGTLHTPKVGGTPKAPAGFDGTVRTSTDGRPVGKVSAQPLANNKDWGPAQTPSALPDRVTSPTKYLPGEGVWVPTKIVVNGVTAVYVARVRPDSLHTSIYATIAWFDPKLLAFGQVAGTKLPEGNFNHGTGRVAAEVRPFYVAGFADGYRMKDSQGGAVINGVVVKKLSRGKATLLTYPDGSINIVRWNIDKAKPGFLTARQNLDVLVLDGKSQVFNEDQAKWGQVWYGTGSGKNYIWRTAIGLRPDGSVVYVQSQALTAKTLADLLVRAGAVIGMSLDMNEAFANGDFYGPYGQNGKAINPDNKNPTSRFFKTSKRDFVSVFAKSPANG